MAAMRAWGTAIFYDDIAADIAHAVAPAPVY